MIINRIYEHQNLLSLQLVSFLFGLRTYQHPCRKECCVYDDYSTDFEAVTPTLMKTEISNFVVFYPTIVSYPFMQDGTMTTNKPFRTHFCSASGVDSRVCTSRER